MVRICGYVGFRGSQNWGPCFRSPGRRDNTSDSRRYQKLSWVCIEAFVFENSFKLSYCRKPCITSEPHNMENLTVKLHGAVQRLLHSKRKLPQARNFSGWVGGGVSMKTVSLAFAFAFYTFTVSL